MMRSRTAPSTPTARNLFGAPPTNSSRFCHDATPTKVRTESSTNMAAIMDMPAHVSPTDCGRSTRLPDNGGRRSAGLRMRVSRAKHGNEIVEKRDVFRRLGALDGLKEHMELLTR